MSTKAFIAGLIVKMGRALYSVATATKTASGSSYVANEIITLTGGGGTGAKIKVLTVSTGAISTFEINAAGSGYAVGDALTQASTTGSGTGATFTVATVSELFDKIEEVRTIGGLGKTNALVDVTNFDSASLTKEYIAGLADGSEIAIDCNLVLTPSSIQSSLVTNVNNKVTRDFKLILTDGTTTLTYDFAAICQSWKDVPSVTTENKRNFGLKITGDITETVS
jgi:hypothetical protein